MGFLLRARCGTGVFSAPHTPVVPFAAMLLSLLACRWFDRCLSNEYLCLRSLWHFPSFSSPLAYSLSVPTVSQSMLPLLVLTLKNSLPSVPLAFIRPVLNFPFKPFRVGALFCMQLFIGACLVTSPSQLDPVRISENASNPTAAIRRQSHHFETR